MDRRSLQAPKDGYARQDRYEVPVGDLEQTIAALWADILVWTKVGRHDDFFALGGHSLLAVTLIERMRQRGLQADVRTLFATPTLAALAAAVGRESGPREVVVLRRHFCPCCGDHAGDAAVSRIDSGRN